MLSFNINLLFHTPTPLSVETILRIKTWSLSLKIEHADEILKDDRCRFIQLKREKREGFTIEMDLFTISPLTKYGIFKKIINQLVDNFHAQQRIV